jgi:hypothetical protein
MQDSIRAELEALETELHRLDTRANRARMEALLHPDFVEFGRSGTLYTRAEILAEYDSGKTLPTIDTRHFRVTLLGANVALVTYVSAHVSADGTSSSRHTLRSSIWVQEESRWQMRFHQGTPTTQASFETTEA